MKQLLRIFIKYSKNLKINYNGLWRFSNKFQINLQEIILHEFNQLVKVLKVFWWNVKKIVRKYFKKYLRKIEKKILNDFRKIMETLLGKIEVIRNYVIDII